MATIHLVRHGEAAAGFGAHKDPGLSELGLSQAKRVATYLAERHSKPMALFSSPLARALETAQPLAERWRADVTIEDRMAEIPSPTADLTERATWLSEAMQGTWQALPDEQILWHANVGRCLLDIEEDCVIFSHFVAINAAVSIASSDPQMRIFAPANCSITTISNADQRLAVISLGGAAVNTKVN